MTYLVRPIGDIMGFDEWHAEGERLGAEDWENWSCHHIVVSTVRLPDPELQFPCDACGAAPQDKCADDCKYQEVKNGKG